MLKVLLFMGSFVIVAPAVAQNQAPSPAQQAPKPSKNGDNRVICQTQEQTGSRIGTKKVCMTAVQWKEHELRVHDELDQLHMGTNAAAGPQ